MDNEIHYRRSYRKCKGNFLTDHKWTLIISIMIMTYTSCPALEFFSFPLQHGHSWNYTFVTRIENGAHIDTTANEPLKIFVVERIQIDNPNVA